MEDEKPLSKKAKTQVINLAITVSVLGGAAGALLSTIVFDYLT